MSDDNTATFPTGARFGAYEVVRALGSGAFGTVYEALRHPLRKRVALKVLNASMAKNPEAVARFLREAEAASQLEHPHIVDVQDLGSIDGVPYLAMEFLEGETLDARLERLTTLSIEDTLAVLLPILSALAVVHERGIIHRDIKPANVFLTPSPHGDHPRLLDFGIAKVASASTDNVLTRTAALLGTPSYMSPEQVKEARTIDARSDIWALGVLLHECVTGRRPFDGESMFETFERIVRAPIPTIGSLVPGASPGFEAVVLLALTRDPLRRIASVRELGSALLPFASTTVQAVWSREFAGATPLAAWAHDDGPTLLRISAPHGTLSAYERPARAVAPTRSLRSIVVLAGAVTALLLVIAGFMSLRGGTPTIARSAPAVLVRNPAPPVAPPVAAPLSPPPALPPVVAAPAPPVVAVAPPRRVPVSRAHPSSRTRTAPPGPPPPVARALRDVGNY